MKIKANGLFLHGRMRFEAGGVYEVADRHGGVFVANGWATEAEDDAPAVAVPVEQLGADAAPAAVDGAVLDVQDVAVGVNGG